MVALDGSECFVQRAGRRFCRDLGKQANCVLVTFLIAIVTVRYMQTFRIG